MVAQTLIEGTGAKVKKTDAIVARYVGYSWKSGKLIDDGFDTYQRHPVGHDPRLADRAGRTPGRVPHTPVLPPDSGF